MTGVITFASKNLVSSCFINYFSGSKTVFYVNSLIHFCCWVVFCLDIPLLVIYLAVNGHLGLLPVWGYYRESCRFKCNLMFWYMLEIFDTKEISFSFYIHPLWLVKLLVKGLWWIFTYSGCDIAIQMMRACYTNPSPSLTVFSAILASSVTDYRVILLISSDKPMAITSLGVFRDVIT